MPELPVVSGREARRRFERLEWTFRRQAGSHMILTKAGSVVSLSIPDHRELAPGTQVDPLGDRQRRGLAPH